MSAHLEHGTRLRVQEPHPRGDREDAVDGRRSPEEGPPVAPDDAEPQASPGDSRLDPGEERVEGGGVVEAPLPVEERAGHAVVAQHRRLRGGRAEVEAEAGRHALGPLGYWSRHDRMSMGQTDHDGLTENPRT